jgi:hypothetical protein
LAGVTDLLVDGTGSSTREPEGTET